MSSPLIKLVKDEDCLAILKITQQGVYCEMKSNMHPMVMINFLNAFIMNLLYQSFQPKEKSLIEKPEVTN